MSGQRRDPGRSIATSFPRTKIISSQNGTRVGVGAKAKQTHKLPDVQELMHPTHEAPQGSAHIQAQLYSLTDRLAQAAHHYWLLNSTSGAEWKRAWTLCLELALEYQDLCMSIQASTPPKDWKRLWHLRLVFFLFTRPACHCCPHSKETKAVVRLAGLKVCTPWRGRYVQLVEGVSPHDPDAPGKERRLEEQQSLWQLGNGRRLTLQRWKEQSVLML